MRSLQIGMVDLDTSHPGAWLPIIRELGHTVSAVFDEGMVRPNGYAEQFAAKHDVGTVCDSLEEMAERVDAVIIHSCNWDMHAERMLPFVRAGKPILVDKPMAGNVRDVMRMKEWHRQGVRITGGSSLRYCAEVQEWLNAHDPRRVVFALAGCSVDEFNYGIHAYSLLHGLLGPGIESVRHLGSGVQRRIELTWSDGRTGMVSVGATPGHLPFYATLVTETDTAYLRVDNTRIYRSMLEKTLPYLAGETEEPVPFGELIEVELAAIAARQSWMSGEGRVSLQGLSDADSGYDGALFGREYRSKLERANRS